MITQEYLKEILEYNSESGVFRWKVNRSANKIKGLYAGSKNKLEYIVVCINYKRYLTHRLAWLYVYGEFPKGFIDHVNGNPSDNRIENLRVVTNRENQQNQKCHRNGHLAGTTYCKRDKKWIAKISLNGKRKHLGSFETEQQAHERYLKELKLLEE